MAASTSTCAATARRGSRAVNRCACASTPQNDLLEEYEDDEERITGYTVHKDVLGTWCRNMMHLTIRYDANRRETGRQAEGAMLIDAAEYERLRQAAPKHGSG